MSRSIAEIIAIESPIMRRAHQAVGHALLYGWSHSSVPEGHTYASFWSEAAGAWEVAADACIEAGLQALADIANDHARRIYADIQLAYAPIEPYGGSLHIRRTWPQPPPFVALAKAIDAFSPRPTQWRTP